MKLYLVRHGSAGIRHHDDPDDRERHLDANGQSQATLIAKQIERSAPFDDPITRVLSSPAARCIETAEPTGRSLGLDVESEASLFEGTDIDDSWALVESISATGRSAMLCSHGDVIPELIARARGRGMSIVGKSGCSKGSLWELTWDGERFSTGRYVPHPT